MGPDGLPLSWQHYVHGIRHIARERIRQQVWLAEGMRVSRVVQDSWVTWSRDMAYLTEVPKNG